MLSDYYVAFGKADANVDSKGRVAIYYGSADTNMAIAFTTVEKLLGFVKKFNA